MLHAIELYFDRATEDAISGMWAELARRKVARNLRDAGSRPHMTLAVYNDMNVGDLKTIAEGLARAAIPLDIAFDNVASFSVDLGVVYLQPAREETLRSLHEQLHQHGETWADRVWAYYRPSNWIPHCTLAMGIPPNELARTLFAARDMYRYISGRIESLGIVGMTPGGWIPQVESLAVLQLGS